MTPALRLCVIGECRVERPSAEALEPDAPGPEAPGSEAPLSATQRRILARLALGAPAPVPVERIAEAVWERDAPRQFRQAIQNQVSRLRGAWGEGIVVTSPGGYALGCETDARHLAALARRAEELLDRGDAAAASDAAEAAIALWRGRPYTDIEHLPEIASAERGLQAALRGAEDLRLEAAIRLGRPVWAAIEAERLHAADPLDERRQALRVRALLLAGRRGEALAAANTARRRLRDELGVVPGPWLAAAEAEALGATASAAAGPYPVVAAADGADASGGEHEERLRGALAGLDPAEAIATAREVAAAANRSGAHQEAVLWLSRCLAVPEADRSTRLMLRIELGDSQRLAGDPAHLSTLLDAAREALDSGDDEATAAACFALLQLGASSTSGRPIPEVRTILERALPRLGDPELRAPVLAAASLASSLVGVAARSRELFTEAFELSVSDETRARVLPFAYMALGAPADLPVRRAAAEELTRLADRLGDPVAAFEAAQLRFSVALQDGRGADARRAVQDLAGTVSRIGDAGRQWALLFVRAAIAHLDGDDEKCERLAAQAQQLFTPVSPARAAAAYAGQLIALRLAQGRIDELAPMLTGLATAQPGIPAFQSAAALASVRADPDSARTRAALALDLAQDDATWLAGHAVGARAVAGLGDAELCTRYLERLEPWSGLGIWQGTCSYGPVDTAIALLLRTLGDSAGMRRHAARARELAEALAARPFLAELTSHGLG